MSFGYGFDTPRKSLNLSSVGSPSSPTPLLSSLNSQSSRPSQYIIRTGDTNHRQLRKARTIVVLGFSMVGKTALCVRFVSDRFEESYEPTYTNSFLKHFHHRSTPVEITIRDTQGMSEQEMLRSEYGLGVHGYVLVYSISSMRSFEVVKTINDKLTNLIGSRNIPRILIGNKMDLQVGGAEVRQVPTEMGQALANKWGCAFAECSAKHNVNIERAFSSLLDEIERASEPERSTLGSGLERLADCLPSWCRFNSPSSPSPPSLTELAQSQDRWTMWAKISVWTTMFLALAGIIYAVYLGIHASDSQEELLCYVLFGFGLIVWLVTLVGMYGLRIASVEFLKVYVVSLGILVVCQLSVWILLYLNISIFSSHAAFVSISGVLALAIQSFASLAGHKLSQAMNANNIGSPSPPAAYATDYHQTSSYHALYE